MKDYCPNLVYPVFVSLLSLLLVQASVRAQPANDEPCDAVLLNVYDGCYDEYYTTIASTRTTTSNAPNPNCGSYTSSDGDVWFRFIMPPSGSVSFDMDGVNIDLSYDESKDMGAAIYSGSSCNSLSQQLCSYNVFSAPSFTFSGQAGTTYWLRVWYFELSTSGAGMFEICANGGNGATPIPAAPPFPDCVNNPAPSDECVNAPLIDNLNGYCGSTANYTSGGSSEPSSANDLFCGSIENNSWLRFTAAEETATFHIYLTGCSGRFQARIFDVDNCANYIPVSNCLETTASPSYLFASGLTPGQEYYVYMDGYTGSSCDYRIAATTGVLVPCENDTMMILGMSCNPADTGTFVQTFTNSQGCDSVEITEIGFVQLLNNQVRIVNESCARNDGAVSTNVSGGTQEYIFSWSTGDTTANISGLNEGLYQVTITDDFGCVRIDSARVNQSFTPGGTPGLWLWTGAADSSWFNPCNWDKFEVPTIQNPVTVPGGTPFQPYIANDTAYCESITIDHAAGGHLFKDVQSGGHLIKQP